MPAPLWSSHYLGETGVHTVHGHQIFVYSIFIIYSFFACATGLCHPIECMQRDINFKSILIIFLLGLSVVFFTKCISDENRGAGLSHEKTVFESFAGSDKCISCHQTIYDSHIHTAHFKTSAIANSENIVGSFDQGKNNVEFNNGGIMKMEKGIDGFYQAAYVNEEMKKKQRFDMVIGSGTKGQSYASWNKGQLVQMPITYFTQTQQWCNSPGYPNKIAFNRPITARCLECHTTYAEENTDPKTAEGNFKNDKFIFGVTCEKCHGPAADHVKYHTGNPNEKNAKFIVNPAAFSRSQSLDLCALCHGGKLEKTQPSFSFTAGKKLGDYFKWDTTVVAADAIDVHGNQLGLLRLSECFVNSATLTCNTCHSPHEKSSLPTFSQKCMGCHSEAHGNFCTEKSVSPDIKKNNCIDCHMPKQASRSIAVILPGQSTITPSYIRTHLVAKYVDETKKYIDGLDNKKANK